MHRLVVRRDLDKRHAYRPLAALTAVSRDAAATATPKLRHDFRPATVLSENGQILSWASYCVQAIALSTDKKLNVGVHFLTEMKGSSYL